MKKAESAKNVIRGAINEAIKRERNKWPPDCAVFTYQPKRPHADDFIQPVTHEQVSGKSR